MLCMVASSKLSFEFSLGQPEGDILNGLRAAFVKQYGEDTYLKATMIIIREENFFNIIKNIYGVPFVGQHNDLLEDIIQEHLGIQGA